MISGIKNRLIGGVALLLGTLAGGVATAAPQVTEGFINAPVAEVWRLFTSPGAGQPAADVKIGGEIRARYDFGDGAEGTLTGVQTMVNEVLAYDPERMLAMRIKQAPANLPHRQAIEGTWSVIYFAPAGDMTQVRMVELGYGEDSESQALRQLFAESNRRVLDQMAKPYWPMCAHCQREAEAASQAKAASQ